MNKSSRARKRLGTVMFVVEATNKRGVTTFLVALQRDHVRTAVDYSRRVNNPG
jgi:PhoPQ-activated pathogenicity-related protein